MPAGSKVRTQRELLWLALFPGPRFLLLAVRTHHTASNGLGSGNEAKLYHLGLRYKENYRLGESIGTSNTGCCKTGGKYEGLGSRLLTPMTYSGVLVIFLLKRPSKSVSSSGL